MIETRAGPVFPHKERQSPQWPVHRMGTVLPGSSGDKSTAQHEAALEDVLKTGHDRPPIQKFSDQCLYLGPGFIWRRAVAAPPCRKTTWSFFGSVAYDRRNWLQLTGLRSATCGTARGAKTNSTGNDDDNSNKQHTTSESTGTLTATTARFCTKPSRCRRH